MPLFFFSHHSHTRQRAYLEVPVQCDTFNVTRRYSFFFPFLSVHCRQSSHSLPCSRFFPDPSIHLFSFTGARYVLLSNTMTPAILLSLFLFMFSSIERVRYHLLVSYPILSHTLSPCLLPKQS
jgi:hypothetical protein